MPIRVLVRLLVTEATLLAGGGGVAVPVTLVHQIVVADDQDAAHLWEALAALVG
jgi:hypothetical protein